MTRSADSIRGRTLAHYSPDGKAFIVILRRGNLEQNTNDFSLLLWKTDEIPYASTPQLLVTLSSSSNRDAIEDIRWLTDNETITFLGENPRDLHELYTFNIRTHTLQKLTSHPTNLISSLTNPKGAVIASVAKAPRNDIFAQNAQTQA